MLEVGRKKMLAKKVDHIIELNEGDSENLPFKDNTFDGLTVAFGVRNFENLKKGLSDMLRVLKPKRAAIILELSKPQNPALRGVYDLYFNYILPVIGKMVSKDHRAYTYLPESVEAFPNQKDFVSIMTELGYKEARCISLMFGICSIYIGKK